MLDNVRVGAEEPMDVSFDFVWEFITASSGSGVPSIEDALKKRGEASGWITTSADVCHPYCVDLEIFYTPPCGGAEKERIVLNEFHYETLEHDLRAGSVSCTGKCNTKEAVVTREV